MKIFWPALVSTALAAGLLSSAPATAQRKTHGAGVSWSGGHGGVSWDGSHDYRGGNYDGYASVLPPAPAYKPPPPKYIAPQLSPPLTVPPRALAPRPGDHPNQRRDGGSGGRR